MTTAIITGGSRGLGLALSRHLVTAGWTVIADGRRATFLDAAAAELGQNFIGVPGDVDDAAHRRALVAAAVEPIDLVVNNASTLGPLPMTRLLDLRPEEFARALITNVVAPLALLQEALPRLADLPAVVNITSDAAIEGYPGWGAYGASKASLEQLSKVLAVEHPQLRVWWVDPGDMRTQMHQDAFPGEDISDRPLPEQIAPAFLRLLDERPPSGRVRASDLLGVPA